MPQEAYDPTRNLCTYGQQVGVCRSDSHSRAEIAMIFRSLVSSLPMLDPYERWLDVCSSMIEPDRVAKIARRVSLPLSEMLPRYLPR